MIQKSVPLRTQVFLEVVTLYQEAQMKILLSLLFIIVVAAVSSGCAEQPRKSVNTAGEQRSHADKAQGELASDVGR